MTQAWHPVAVAGGTVRVMLPEGEDLEDHEGIVSWSPAPESGRFTVLRGAAQDGDGDELLAAERSDGEVDVEHDSSAERGGLPVRHLRYRSRRHTPRVVLDRGSEGLEHGGDEDVDSLTDVLFVRDGNTIVRVGYTVLASAPSETRDVLAETLDRVRIGNEP
jgi:hypothetical protein